MRQELALRLLGEVMRWDEDQARREFQWLTLASRFKYDGYSDFVAGARFVESLADWLQQFPATDRAGAYAFIRQSLIYINSAEIQHLVDLFFPELIQRRLAQAIALEKGIPAYLVWAESDTEARFAALLRRTLFLGLSDGARIDVFRRSNTGRIKNDQVVALTTLDDDKWNELLDELRSDTQDPTALFRFVVLIDDFVGSGASLLRKKEQGSWTGKLVKFYKAFKAHQQTHFSPNVTVLVHHYIASSDAATRVVDNEGSARSERGGEWFPNSVEFSFGMVLSPIVQIIETSNSPIVPLAKTFYDPAIETKATWVGGTSLEFGFAKCGLPLVLEHNTPNNSIGLLWAESDGASGRHPMRPLFRRRQRHT